MIILSANNLSKVYGTDIIIEKVSFHINAGDRVGIVGRNGAGKTTLLNMLAGEMSCDEGEFFVSQNLRTGYLKQRENFRSGSTVIEEIERIFSPIRDLEGEIDRVTGLLAENPTDEKLQVRLADLHEEHVNMGGATYKSEIKGILNSMAFGEDFYDKEISQLSGGERTRLALAALLLEKPDLLMLDEPTNHLDIGTLKWLEQYLSAYKGTIIVVSHDRYFLNQLVNRVFEVENHKLYCYNGNYGDFAEQKRLRRESEMRAYNNQQKEILRQEEIIRRFKGHNTEKLVKRAQSREKKLEAMERLERPQSEMGRMKIHFKQNFQSGNDVLKAEALSKTFGQGTAARQLFRKVDFDIKRGERIAIVGPNGIGKTTLLRIILGEAAPTEGTLKIGHNVAFGYYDQGQLLLSSGNTVFEELKESYKLYTDTEMRSILGRFLFKNEEVFIKVGDLSGGEKARLSLLKMMLSGANTLILDEPTNHLDIDSKEVFEDALAEFPGTVIVVSHDRYFLQKIPTRILELQPEGLTEYLGKYDYYLEKKASIESGKKYLETLKTSSDKEADRKIAAASEKELRQLNKQKEAEERRRKREIENLEEKIAEYEEEIDKLQGEMQKSENALNYEFLAETGEKINSLRELLDRSYDQWSDLQQ